MFFRRMVICIMNIYYLSFLSKGVPIASFFLSFICSWFSNKLPPAIINNPISLLCLPSLKSKNNHAFYLNLNFCFEKHFFLKYFKNNLKILWQHFLIVLYILIVLVLTIPVVNEPLCNCVKLLITWFK